MAITVVRRSGSKSVIASSGQLWLRFTPGNRASLANAFWVNNRDIIPRQFRHRDQRLCDMNRSDNDHTLGRGNGCRKYRLPDRRAFRPCRGAAYGRSPAQNRLILMSPDDLPSIQSVWAPESRSVITMVGCFAFFAAISESRKSFFILRRHSIQLTKTSTSPRKRGPLPKLVRHLRQMTIDGVYRLASLLTLREPLHLQYIRRIRSNHVVCVSTTS